MFDNDIVMELNLCDPDNVFEIAERHHFCIKPKPIVDAILTKVTNAAIIDRLANIGFVPAHFSTYGEIYYWAKHLDAHCIGESLLNGRDLDFPRGTLPTLTSCLEALNYVPEKYIIGTVYATGYSCNTCSTVYKLQKAKTHKVVASIQLIKSLWVPGTIFRKSFDANVDFLKWDSSNTERTLAESLSAVMNRSHCELVVRTVRAVRAAAKYLKLSLETIIKRAFSRAVYRESAVSSAGGMLMYVPESRMSWFPGADSCVFRMFHGHLDGYIQSSTILGLANGNDVMLSALKAGAVPPPPSSEIEESVLYHWRNPLTHRNPVTKLDSYYFCQYQTLLLCFKKQAVFVPLEIRLLIIDIAYQCRKF